MPLKLEKYRVLGFAAFFLCAWFAYECGLGARNSASSAYTHWLNAGATSGQFRVASGQNGLWMLAMVVSLVMAVLFLSTAFDSKRRMILRKGISILLLLGSCVPFSFAFTILFPLFHTGGKLTQQTRVSSWSSGGLTLHGWQVYAGALVFALIAISMIVAGARFISPSANDQANR